MRRLAPALLLLAACPQGEAPGQPPPLAQLVATTGQVTLQRAGAATPAAPGPLRAGDALVTGDHSSAQVELSDGRRVDVGENTTFRVREGGAKISLEVEEGSIVSRAVAGGRVGMTLEILTPFGASSIPAGSAAQVAVAQGRLRLDVLEGEISVVSQDGKPTVLHRGEKVELGRPVATLEPIELVLSAERGAPTVKRRSEARYAPVSGDAVPAEEGASFQVGAGSRLLLASKGLRVHLAAGARGTLGKAVRDEQGERYPLELAQGTASVEFAAGSPRELALQGPAGPVSLRARADAAATVTQSPRGPSVEIHAGEVEVSAGGPALTLKAGESAQLSGGELHKRARARPALVLPAHRVRVYLAAPAELGIECPEGQEACTVDVARDAAFSQTVVSGRASGGWLPLAAPASGELHWRALGPDGKVARKGEARFEKDPQWSPFALEHPTARVDETGLKAVVYFQSVPPALTFTYDAVKDAAQYRLEVFRTADLARPVVTAVTRETQYPLEGGRLTEGEYVWRAAPLAGSGAELSGGRMNRLELVYDNSMQTLAIERPREGEKGAPGPIDASGVAPLGTRLTVNGKPAPLDDKGRFHVQVPASETAVFRLVGANGSESYWIRHVRSGS